MKMRNTVFILLLILIALLVLCRRSAQRAGWVGPEAATPCMEVEKAGHVFNANDIMHTVGCVFCTDPAPAAGCG
jgi:hypothetical protein